MDQHTEPRATPPLRRSNIKRPTEPPERPIPAAGLCTLAQLLPYVGTSGQTWRKWVREGRAPRERVGGHRRHMWSWADVRAFIDGRTRRRPN